MNALYYIVLIVFVIVCILLVSIILMQSSKTGGMGAGMGGNTALNTAFGGQGADKLLVKITTILATLFMVTQTCKYLFVRAGIYDGVLDILKTCSNIVAH